MNMKGILSIVVGVVLMGVSSGTTYYFVYRDETKKLQQQQTIDRAALSAAKAQATVAVAEPPDVVVSNVDTTNWQTFSDTTLGYSYTYPADWTISSAMNASGYPIPKNYVTTFQQNITSMGKATPVPLMMSCSADTTTAAEYIQQQKDFIKGETTFDNLPSMRDFQAYTLTSGVVAQYYLWEALYGPLQEFVVSHNGTFCILSIMRPAESPLTKAQDGIAFQILNSLTFTK